MLELHALMFLMIFFSLRDAESKGDRDHALIIDGKSLAYALIDHRDAMQELCEIAVTVLCCRMSPIQKAQVHI